MAKKKRSTRKYAPQLGDIVSIKIRKETFAIARIAFISEHDRGVLLFRAYDVLLKCSQLPEELPVDYRCKLYASTEFVASGRWQVIGRDQSAQGDDEASMYRTVDAVYQGDRRLRDVAPRDKATIPPQVIHGYRSAEDALRDAFGL